MLDNKKNAIAQSLDDVTDWYIPEDPEQKILIYPGSLVVSGELEVHAKKLREMVQWRQGQEAELLRDWRLEYRGHTYRAHRQRTVDGVMYILRRFSMTLPDIMGLGLPSELLSLAVGHTFSGMGGLVLVSGGPGQGKSTTCAAILVERVCRYGYFGLTVEDPPEFSLHGDHEAKNGRIGKIVQVPAAAESFASDLKDALRCYPSNSQGSMLMVGEVRDGDTAAQVLRAAVNGQLVLATLHSSDPIGALERILTLAKQSMGKDEANSLLAHSLRLVIQQRLLSGRLVADFLISTGPTSSVAARIKSGNLALLSTDVQQQKTQALHGRLLESLA